MNKINHDPALYKKAKEEFKKDIIQSGFRHRESYRYVCLILDLVKNIIYMNPTDVLGKSVQEFFNVSCFFRIKDQYVYKLIRYKILPALKKNHKNIEKDKQKKLTFLANQLDKVGRKGEAHVVRIIVKPYIYELNSKWREMTAMEKFKTVIRW